MFTAPPAVPSRIITPALAALCVTGLVNEMTRNGLKFAPASDGGENAYNALYQSLLAYDSALGQMAPPVLSASAQPKR